MLVDFRQHLMRKNALMGYKKGMLQQHPFLFALEAKDLFVFLLSLISLKQLLLNICRNLLVFSEFL